jgi:site-specific DNA-adenine methylase
MSIIRYTGTCGELAPKISRWYAPDYYDEYREACIGSGKVFFSLPAIRSRWINDLNPYLTLLYEQLQQNTQRFWDDCRRIGLPRPFEPLFTKPQGRKVPCLRLARLFSKYHKLLRSKHHRVEEADAVKWYFLNRMSSGGRVNLHRHRKSYYSYSNGWKITQSNRISKAGAFLRGTKITNLDFEEVLGASSDLTPWIFIDPPFVSETTRKRGAQFYDNSFETDDFLRLRGAMEECDHNVCLMLDDRPSVRSLFNADKFAIHSEKKVMDLYNQHGHTQKFIEVVFITNYEISRKPYVYNS